MLVRNELSKPRKSRRKLFTSLSAPSRDMEWDIQWQRDMAPRGRKNKEPKKQGRKGNMVKVTWNKRRLTR